MMDQPGFSGEVIMIDSPHSTSTRSSHEIVLSLMLEPSVAIHYRASTTICTIVVADDARCEFMHNGPLPLR